MVVVLVGLLLLLVLVLDLTWSKKRMLQSNHRWTAPSHDAHDGKVTMFATVVEVGFF